MEDKDFLSVFVKLNVKLRGANVFEQIVNVTVDAIKIDRVIIMIKNQT